MIPKIIHYCWLSNDPIPQQHQDCMQTWKTILPDYKWIKWDLSRFDINSSVWVREAFENKKYAFAADYIRLYAIFTMGGVYMDMDVEVLKPFDKFLENDFFTFNEYYPKRFQELGSDALLDANGRRIKDGKIAFGLQAAVLGGEKGSNHVKELMSYYENRHFVLPDGNLDTSIIAPTIYAHIAERWGFIYRDIEQKMNDRATIYPSKYVAATGDMRDNSNYAVHHCAHSWASSINQSKLRHFKKKLCVRIAMLAKRLFYLTTARICVF